MTRLAAGIYETVSADLRVTITDVTAHSGRLDAWVEVHHGKRRLTAADYNLRGARTVSTLVRECELGAPGVKADWRGFLGDAIYEAIHDMLTGDPAVEMTGADARPPGWLVNGLVEDEQATSFFGFGESGKSLLALAVCCTIASGDSAWLGLEAAQEGPTLTLDWEASDRPFDWRLSQLSQGIGRKPPRGVWHRHESLPLAKILPSVAREVARTKAVLVVVDSVSRARGTSGDWGQQGTGDLYEALSRLSVPALLIDHRAKGSGEDRNPTPWGVVQNFNNLRLGWAVSSRGVSSQGFGGGFDIRLRRAKANNWGMLRDHAWQLRFTADDREARFEPVDPLLVMPGGDATVKDRVFGVLLAVGGEGTLARDVAREVGVPDNNARAVLSALKKEGRAVQVGGRWMAESQWDQEEAPF